MSEAQKAEPTLDSWNLSGDGSGGSGAREAIEAFVGLVTNEGPDYVAPPERIAVFDNDGTLWSEKPFYFQKAFIESREGQDVREESLEDYSAAVLSWLETALHPEKNIPYTDLIYQPMLELLRYLRFHEFKTFIISGGGIEFVRPWAEAAYGIPPEQVVGSSMPTAYRDDPPSIVRLPARSQNPEGDAGKRVYQETLFIDDKWGKPVGISTHIGRRPIAAFGNSDGDKQMLEWTTAGNGPGNRRFGLLIHHTDAVREWAYDEPSDQGQLTPGTLEEAAEKGWMVVDMAADWNYVSPPYPTSGD